MENTFFTWLLHKGLAPRSCKDHQENLHRFEQWAKQEHYSGIDGLCYRELLGYAQHLKSQPLSIATVNIRLNSITKYYEYIKEQGIRDDNPARGLRIKRLGKRVIKDVLNMEQMEALYIKYTQKQKIRENNKAQHGRNCVVLGMMIWQGVHSGELKKMETKDVDLTAGTIHIPATSRSNSRTIQLQPRQIIAMHAYLNGIREQLHPEENELIPGNTYSIINWLVRDLQRTQPGIKNSQHIRVSVIMHWIKQHKIRQVQYLCGHKHISSTERYREEDLENLQKQLNKYHPFG